MPGLTIAVAALAVALADIVAAPTAVSPAEPATLAWAGDIRVAADARYAALTGRGLAVTEAAGTGAFGSYTLVSDRFELPRSVVGHNGVYYALCARGASCPYPTLPAAWAADAWLPRRLALELAARTFRETAAELVVVALPTARPVWFVAEREDVLAHDGDPALATLAEGDPTAFDERVRAVVERLTRPLLYVPVVSVPPSRETVLAVQLQDAVPPTLRIVAIRATSSRGACRVRMSLEAADDVDREVPYTVTVTAGGRFLATDSGASKGRTTIIVQARKACRGKLSVQVVAWDAGGNVTYAAGAARGG